MSQRIYTDEDGVAVYRDPSWRMDQDDSPVPDEFTVTFHRAEEGGWWIESSVEGALSQGDTLEEAAVMAIEAVKLMCEEESPT